MWLIQNFQRLSLNSQDLADLEFGNLSLNSWDLEDPEFGNLSLNSQDLADQKFSNPCPNPGRAGAIPNLGILTSSLEEFWWI